MTIHEKLDYIMENITGGSNILIDANKTVLCCTFKANGSNGSKYPLDHITVFDSDFLSYGTNIIYLNKIGNYRLRFKGVSSSNNSGYKFRVNFNNNEIFVASTNVVLDIVVEVISNNTPLYFSNDRFEGLSGALVIEYVKNL